ncbi:Dual-specificity RNA methyltransferase [Desulfonema limicola]|uniref:Probable dual-specificity RNA methyltransferase RlmN n=1 Tax=Desulfonema limicola TaxID=45656 RepID=A0A975B730_9BACT|nr:23S rRNA (adenine(2503)-C(2))-methyltransferase RlmN [Desulfonema limicola]QTA79760.1 Dual-specificity RNA methyltransferase [Desulfonema limicola]
MTYTFEKTDIKELTKDQLISWLKQKNIAPFRAGQIMKWVYLHQADQFEQMTDLGKDIRVLLSEHFSIQRLNVQNCEISKDGSVKNLLKLQDGNLIESVLIPEKNHYTLCISSQAGCALGCKFCLTAQNGFTRNLTMGEIIAQVRDPVKTIKSDDTRRLTNIVFMGMGEPLANYKNVVNALSIITDSDFGLKMSTRRITISTAGLIEKFPNLDQDTGVNLAVSLNAADNKTRDMLMPINKKYPIEALLDACKKYPLRPRRRITFEYILIQGINDSVKDAENLAKLLQKVKAKVNLIPFNEHRQSPFKRPDESAIHKFQDILVNKNLTAVIRYSKGLDISAACGQLSAKETVF